MIRRLLPGFLVLSLVGGFLWTLYFLYQKSRHRPVVFETMTPFITEIVKKTVAPGAIVPRREITIKPRVSGVVERLFIRPGDIVKKNQPLAKIKLIPDVVTLNNAESSVRAAEISFKNADKERERFQKLHGEGVISQTEYNRYSLEYDLKNQELSAARSNLQLVKEGASKGSNKVSNEVMSTVDGMVIEVPVKEGGSVTETNNFNEGTTIATVADMRDLIFSGFIDESEIGKLKEGMTVAISVGAVEGKSFEGRLEYISPKGADKEGTIQFEIRAALKLSDGAFVRANYSANADIILDRRHAVLALPESVVEFEKGKPYVEVEVGEQRFEKRYPKLGLSDGINIEVLSGLDQKTRVKKPRPEGEQTEAAPKKRWH
ncbi:MAG TPA: efflux RND transporter periplasmic adaptor subunit [Polyangiaceae bacterium]